MDIKALTSDYTSICRELGITPSAYLDWSAVDVGVPANLRDAIGARGELETATDGGATYYVDLDPSHGGLVGALRSDGSNGCADCLAVRHRALSRSHPDCRAVTFDALHALTLCIVMLDHHQLAFAMTGSYAPQNWSLVLPLPRCRRCGGRPRVHPPYHGSSLSSASASARGSGGPRSIGAADFVRANRGAIGFASIMANPASSTRNIPAGTHIVNAPVCMGPRAEDFEVAGGKGETPEQALASCLGEGLERYFLTGASRPPGVVSSRAALVARGEPAIDPVAEFGFPVTDTHPTIRRYSDSLAIEWVETLELGTNRRRALMPSNLVFCPYIPPTASHAICVGSTNGAATGVVIDDAIRQAMMEVVERDAFWYYARTGDSPSEIPSDALPSDVLAAIDQSQHSFVFALLENPYRVPVVQATLASADPSASRTARGTGAHLTLEEAVRRAFIECIQMFASLSSGLLVDPCSFDMRNLWFTGSARDIWPSFFRPDRKLDRSTLYELHSPAEVVEHLKAVAEVRGERWWCTVLAETETFCVVKVSQSTVSVVDSTYFDQNDRLATFAAGIGRRLKPVLYRGPLFM